MARPKKNRDEGGGASWMDTYGDLVTLLLCFFVMLFASSSINEQKWIEIVKSFTGSPPRTAITTVDFGSPVAGGNGQNLGTTHNVDSDDLEGQVELVNQMLEDSKSKEQKQIEEEFNQLYNQLNSYIQANGLSDAILLTKQGLYIYITIAEGILFNSGSAAIRDEQAVQVLTQIGNMLARYLPDIANITVEGHTDNNPIHNAQFEDNLDLSSKRANNVARFMHTTSAIPNDMFWSLGRSEFDPIASNDTAAGRERNRRVQLVIMAKDVDGIRTAGIGTEVKGFEGAVSSADNPVEFQQSDLPNNSASVAQASSQPSAATASAAENATELQEAASPTNPVPEVETIPQPSAG